MTIEKAIEILKEYELNPCVPEDREAIDMAIEALEREKNPNSIRINFVGEEEAKEFNEYLKNQQPCDDCISALEKESKTGWNNHQIACMLADLFGDACACNYNGIDEWLGELCDFKDTCCPNSVGVACWEQFLKYSQSRYTECSYEVRDKGVLKESILDKIRAELHSTAEMHEDGDYYLRDEWIDEYFDKYKAESEEV